MLTPLPNTVKDMARSRACFGTLARAVPAPGFRASPSSPDGLAPSGFNPSREAWDFLCRRLQRDPYTSEESDTLTMRAAWKAMLAFADRPRIPTHLLEDF